jgi:predicted Fe-S protein YdhL (DUF1289 family)
MPRERHGARVVALSSLSPAQRRAVLALLAAADDAARRRAQAEAKEAAA